MVWLILISLLVIGLILLITEILFVPGTTIVGIIGLAVTATGIFYAFISFEPALAWTILIIAGLTNLITLVYGLRSGAWKKFALKSSNKSSVFENRLEGLSVGMEGRAISDIKPFGKAEIGDKIYEVKSSGGFIAVGSPLQIVKLENNTIIVKS